MRAFHTTWLRHSALLFSSLSLLLSAEAQQITFQDNWYKTGIRLASSDRDGVTVSYSMTGFTFSTVDINGRSMTGIELQGFWLPNDAGAPDLPGGGRLIAIPEGATASIEILAQRTERYQHVDLAPAPEIPLDTDRGPLKYQKRDDIYGRDDYYPATPVTLSNPMQIRGVDAVMLGITPFQYNPVTRELIVYRDLEISVTFTGGNGQYGEERLRSRFWDPILKDALLNPASLPEIDYGSRAVNRSSTGCEYLIITPDSEDYMPYAEEIRLFRIKQGITTDIVTLAEIGSNTPSGIESYIDDAYFNWDPAPAAILIMGDYGSNQQVNVTAPIWDAYCASDNIFGDVDNDELPDIVMARMTANNTDQLETFISKFMDYETDPPTSPAFYNHPITALGWQTERWFQLCSEIVGGYFKNVHGKLPVRINEVYEGNPGVDPWSTAQNTSTILSEFGPSGLGYIPATPQELGGWSGGDADAINNAINSGSFMLQHRDHGEETGWGEPLYHNNDINGLTNTDLTFIFSINCLTGKYNWSNECFTEKFHRYKYNGQNSGALALIGASETSYSFVNDTYVWGMMDNMWPDFMPAYGSEPSPRGLLPAFGNAAGKYFLFQSSWPYNTGSKIVTYHLFHHHGDAFLNLYSEVPQPLTLMHDGVILAYMDEFTITTTAGATICMTVDDQIISLATGTGSPQTLAIIPQPVGTNIVLTVTKENYFRHEEVIEVIPAEGPYCIYSSHTLEDSLGNGNGLAEYNEIISLNLEMKNVGLDPGQSVMAEINTVDPFITILDETELYGTIEAGGELSIDGAFTIQIAENVPDQHKAYFNLVAHDSVDTWTSTFMLPVNAPRLNINTLTINDQTGGNGDGQLDPGETVSMTVNYINSGHATAYDVDVFMEGQSGFIGISNPEQNFPFIGFLGQFNKTFEVTVDADAPEGILVNFVNEMAMGNFFIAKIFPEKISPMIEDFETGDFSQFDWESGGNTPWQVIAQYPYEGFYTSRSGVISHSQTSSMELTYEVMNTDTISFYRKVSSAEGDELRFYIGNDLMGSWSGVKSWLRVAYEVTPGMKTFKWIYAKNSGGVSGSDCAWVDKISFPGPTALTLWAGPDAEICPDEVFMVAESYGTEYNGLEWSTSGTGTFSDNVMLHPEYSPSSGDLESGQVVLTLTLWNTSGDTVSDEMTLGIRSLPEAPAVVTGPDYVDLYVTTTTEYSIIGLEGVTEYLWLLEPEGSGTAEGTGTSAVVTWNPEYLGIAALSVAGSDECGTGSFSEPLEITLDNTVGLDDGHATGSSLTILPNPSNGLFHVNLENAELNLPVRLKVFNLMGECILSGDHVVKGVTSFAIDLGRWPAGIYLLKVESSGMTQVKKLVVR